MSPALAQRQVALAGAALLALVAALALVARAEDSPPEAALPRSVPAPGGGWYQAIGAPYRFRAGVERTACGHAARAETLGVAHPVLPCGAKLVIRYAGRTVLSQVVDRGTGRPGRELELTAALAADVGLRGVEPVQWRFAAR